MKNIKYFFLAVFLILSANPLRSQLPAPLQNTPVAIKGGTVVTVSGGIIEDCIVVFNNGIITAVGKDAAIPPDAKIFDAEGKYVYPALIHARSSVGLSEISRVAETVDLNEHGSINPNIRAQVAFNAESEHIPLARTHGIAVTVATPAGGIIPGMSAAMLTDGWNWEEMTLLAPAALIINWPGMSDVKLRENAIRELEDAFLAARRYLTARQGYGEPGVPRHKTDVRWEALIPVLEREVPVHINANDLIHIQSAIRWAEKQNIRMVLVGGRDAGYVLPELKEKNIPVIVTPVIGGPSRQWEAYDGSYSLPARLHEAGIEYCIAGDFASANAIRLVHHSTAAVAFGLPQEEALKAVTLHPARILGIDSIMGSVEEGKDASLIIADGNLLELSTRIEQVFIKGREIHMHDKHRRLYDRYQLRYNR
jgi:imidazolonepropionase-like amidohydrolase